MNIWCPIGMCITSPMFLIGWCLYHPDNDDFYVVSGDIEDSAKMQ